MTEYVVQWVIDIDAEDPISAALQAFDWLRDPENVATVFNVQEGNTVGMVNPGVDVDVKLYEDCTCPPGVAEGVADGPLCEYCKWQNSLRHGDEIPY